MICKYCFNDKKVTEFYPRNKVCCKKCIRERSRKYHQEKYLFFRKRKKDYQKEYYFKWYAKNGRNRADNYIEAILHWKEKHPEAIKAHLLVHRALNEGSLKRPKICSGCKKKKRVFAHHKDYSKALFVLWLCGSCHKLEHLKKIKT